MDKINPEAIKTPGIFIPFDLDQERVSPDMAEHAIEESVHRLGNLGVEMYQVTLDPKEEVKLRIPEDPNIKRGKISLSELKAELVDISDRRAVAGGLIGVLYSLQHRTVKFSKQRDHEESFMYVGEAPYGESDEHWSLKEEDIQVDLDNLAGYVAAGAFTEHCTVMGMGPKRRSLLNQALNSRLQMIEAEAALGLRPN